MVRSAARRFAIAIVPVCVCALAYGCAGNPSYFPYLLPPGPAVPVHPKPAGPGYFADFDPYACRIELRPDGCTMPVRGTQVLIATVYDGDGLPRRNRRVEWIIEGPGSIIEVDESGFLPGRGMKIDNRFAYSQTDYLEHCIKRGGGEFSIGPGQTWCVISSAVEGETVVTAYVPAIADWNKNRAYARIAWTGAGLEYPANITVRAGGEASLGTKVANGAEGYRVRYRIVDGPPAALNSARGAPVESVTEAISNIGTDGSARVAISQPAPAIGTNRIAIEVIKPNPDSPGNFTVVSKGETKVTWQAPQIGVTVSAPRTLALNQDVPVTYAIADNGPVDAGDVTVTAQIPTGMTLVQTEPRAVVDGDDLIWTLPAGARGKAQSVKAIFRPARLGTNTLTADARAHDGTAGHGSATVNVAAAKLLLRMEGPATGIVGESLPFKITVTNAGDGPTDKVRVQARLADGLETANKSTTFDETIASLSPGQSKTLSMPLAAKRGGKHAIQAVATAENNLAAIPQDTIVEIQDAQIALTAHGPPRGYIGEDVTWQLVVRNTGDVPMGKIAVRATLPPEVSFVKATDGGRLTGRQVVWELGTAPARQERTIAVTVSCDKPTGKAAMSASVSASPVVERSGVGRTVSNVKLVASEKPAEAVLEILGVPALQMSVKDANDPIGVGQKTTYSIRVKNAGTIAASKVEISAEVPASMRPIRASGPSAQGKIDGQKITFAAIPSLAPNAESTFVVEVEALVPGNTQFRAEARSALLAQPLRAEEPTRILGRESLPGGQ